MPETPSQTFLNVGAVGTNVTVLQQALFRNGFDPGPIDGVYGSQTRIAVESFQRDRNLVADGVAGPDTLQALGLSDGGVQADAGERVVTVEAAVPPSLQQRDTPPYVAAITESSRKLPRVQQVFGNATLDSAR
ncbi:MAG: peptidoglycan-binding domain-containing protein, partial [Cyanobacteria bacterium J06642_11]